MEANKGTMVSYGSFQHISFESLDRKSVLMDCTYILEIVEEKGVAKLILSKGEGFLGAAK